MPYVVELEALNDDYDIATSEPIKNVCILSADIEIMNATKIQTLLKNEYMLYDVLLVYDENDYDGMRDAARIYTIDVNRIKAFIKIAKSTDEFVILIKKYAEQLSF